MKKKHAVDQYMTIGELKRINKLPYLDKHLSMDEYFKFVNFCAEHFSGKKMSKKEWFAMHRGVPFSLK